MSTRNIEFSRVAALFISICNKYGYDVIFVAENDENEWNQIRANGVERSLHTQTHRMLKNEWKTRRVSHAYSRTVCMFIVPHMVFECENRDGKAYLTLFDTWKLRPNMPPEKWESKCRIPYMRKVCESKWESRIGNLCTYFSHATSESLLFSGIQPLVSPSSHAHTYSEHINIFCFVLCAMCECDSINETEWK